MSKAHGFVLFTALQLFSLSAWGADFLEEERTVGRRIKLSLASLDVHLGAGLANWKFFEGLGLSATYAYSVEPSYQGGYYTRVDRYTLNFAIRPGDFFDFEKLPIYLNIDRGSEFIFVRQFQSQLKALAAVPVFDPRRIPLTARLALDFMEPGDFVAIPATFEIVLGAGVSQSLIGALNPSADFNAFLYSGRFQIHVFRLPDSKVRLRFISEQSRGWELGAGIRTGFSILGISAADSVINHIVKLDIPRVSLVHKNGALVMLDYIYDLANPEAAEAYNRALSTTFKYKLKNLVVSEDVRERMVSDLVSTELIEKQDRALPRDDRRIYRVFSGDNSFNSTNLKLS